MKFAKPISAFAGMGFLFYKGFYSLEIASLYRQSL